MPGKSLVGSLRIALGLDSAAFDKGLDRAQGKLGGFAKAAGPAFAVVGAAALAVGAAVAAGVRESLNAADDMGKAAQKFGVAVEPLSRLKHAADLSDVSMDQLGTGLQKLGRNMAEVAGGGGKQAARAFDALGISVKNADGTLKSTDQVLNEVAGKFGNMQDGAGKTALAMQLFGKSGAELIPMLNLGSEGLAEMAAESDALGLTISSKTAAAAEQFNDNLTRLGKVFGGITNQIAAAFAPTLAALTDGLVETIKQSGFLDAVTKTLSLTFKGLATGLVIVGTALKTQFTLLSTVASAFNRVIRGDFGGAWQELAKGAQTGVADFRGAANTIQRVWTETGADVKAIAPKVSDQIAAPIAMAVGKAKKAAAELSKIRIVDPASERLAIDRTGARTVDLTKERIKVPVILELDEGATNRMNAQIEAINDNLADAAALAAEAFDRAFGHVAGSFDQLFHSLSRKNWVGAAAGLIGAAKAIREAFGAGGTTAGKIGAAAGVADALGMAVGGSAGSGLSGAAGGAMLGLKLGTVIPGVGNVAGAAIGAVLGGIAGLFSGSKAKKQQREAEARARAEEEARRVAEEASRQLTIANSKRALEIQLMEIAGDSAGALKARREDELRAANDLDPALGELTQKLFDAQDAAVALAQAEEASAAAREAQAQAIADAQAAVDAASAALRDAYDREASGIEAFRDRFQGLADGIGKVLDSLFGAGRSSSLQALTAEFNRVGALARLGDERALAEVQELAPGLAQAVRSQARNGVEAARGLAAIRSTLKAARDTATRQVSVADQQLAELRAQVGALINLDGSVLSVSEGIANLQAAQAELVALTDTSASAIVAELQGIRGGLDGMRSENVQLQGRVEQNTYAIARILDGATRQDGWALNTVAG